MIAAGATDCVRKKKKCTTSVNRGGNRPICPRSQDNKRFFSQRFVLETFFTICHFCSSTILPDRWSCCCAIQITSSLLRACVFHNAFSPSGFTATSNLRGASTSLQRTSSWSCPPRDEGQHHDSLSEQCSALDEPYLHLYNRGQTWVDISTD